MSGSARLAAFLAGLADRENRPRSGDARQRPTWFMPDLEARPFHDPRRFSWLKQLEAAASVIDGELGGLLERAPPPEHPAARALARGAGWGRFVLFDHGRANTPVTSRCPRTVEVVSSIRGADAAGLVYLSALRPRTRIMAHCGPTNTRLRCHLGLRVPRGSRIVVGGQSRTFRAGRCIVFDDSFEHEAHNPSDELRVVLIVDVWHPALSATERAALSRAFATEAFNTPHPSPKPRAVAPLPRVGPVGALAAFAHAGAGAAPPGDDATSALPRVTRPYAPPGARR